MLIPTGMQFLCSSLLNSYLLEGWVMTLLTRSAPLSFSFDYVIALWRHSMGMAFFHFLIIIDNILGSEVS